MKRVRLNKQPAAGRTAGGQFAKGNKVGHNKTAALVRAARDALVSVVTKADVRKVATALVKLAVGGDVRAAKLILSYVAGQPESLDLLERLDELEAAVLKHVGERR